MPLTNYQRERAVALSQSGGKVTIAKIKRDLALEGIITTHETVMNTITRWCATGSVRDRPTILVYWFQEHSCEVTDVYPFLTANSTLNRMAATWEQPSPKLHTWIKLTHDKLQSNTLLIQPTHPAMQVQCTDKICLSFCTAIQASLPFDGTFLTRAFEYWCFRACFSYEYISHMPTLKIIKGIHLFPGKELFFCINFRSIYKITKDVAIFNSWPQTHILYEFIRTVVWIILNS